MKNLQDNRFHAPMKNHSYITHSSFTKHEMHITSSDQKSDQKKDKHDITKKK